MNKLCFLAITAITFAITLSTANGSESVTVYESHGFLEQHPTVRAIAPEDFLIMPWGWSPGDEKALNEIKECGFNAAGFLAPQYAKIAEKVGLKYIVDDTRISGAVGTQDINDDEITRRVQECTAALHGDPRLLGYYMYDEPTADQFTNLGRWRKALAKIEPNAICYINLLPRDIKKSISVYEEYIEKFIAAVHPSYLSYDLYSLYDDGTMNQDYFYSNIEIMRRVAIRHKLPFWNIILANNHFHYSISSPGSLNVQVYSTLAYGGRGIGYFSYFAPIVGNYRDAAIDQFMNKTPTWDRIRSINTQIHKLAPTYLKLKSVNVFHHPEVPQECKGIAASKYVAEINGGNFLVGEFEDAAGCPYLLVVNKDIQKSASFTVTFKDPGRIMMVSPYTGLTVPFGGENNWLAPGQGILLSVIK
jgi:hypothetical protein